MKYLIIILTLLILWSFSYGQEYRLWGTEVITATAAGTEDSDYFNFTNDASNLGKFLGLTCITLDVDSSTTVNGADDSLLFYPMYKINGTWFTGDTIEWDRIKTANYTVDDAFIDTNIEYVLPSVLHDSLLVWRNDPTSTTTVEGYPVWQEFKLRVSYNDSVTFIIDTRAGRH